MSSTATREDQMFPILDASQITAARRFASGPETSFEPGTAVYEIAAQNAPAWLVLRGAIEIVRRDGLNREAIVTNQGIGQFTGEVAQLAGRPSLVGAYAGPEGCIALPFDAAHLRALMVGSADLGEIVMRALILRRVALIAEGGAGTILIGRPGSRHVVQLQGFLTRSGFPNLVLDADVDDEGRALVERAGILPDDLPLVVCPGGTILKKPSERDVAACLGMMPTIDPETMYDVAVVGAGPAGLATAVYAASEGLRVIVLDARSTGGQAGASARIENYLGFPTGISGQALAGRAFNQALKFGAEIAVPVGVERLDCSSGELSLELAGNQRLTTRSVVIASGARYRKPVLPNLSTFEGAGISYWASPIEARLCAGEEIALVGGGNSAGQAIVFLAPQVKRLHVVVRRDLHQTMSRYLLERIEALANVEIHVGFELTALEGDAQSGLEAATFKDMKGAKPLRLALHHLFLFIGAEPNADWANGCIDTDAKGFVVTGRTTQSLETSVRGVFAIGDVRSGSTKRVAAAVGEGAAVVAQIHALLAEHSAKEVV